MYHVFNNFESLIMPVLCVLVTSCMFCSLFLSTSPCFLDILHLEIWMEHLRNDECANTCGEKETTYLM